MMSANRRRLSASLLTGGLAIFAWWYFWERPHSFAREMVRAELVDPESAQFRNLHTKGDKICGEVNAKNGMGGYVGFVPFVVSKSSRGNTVVIQPRPHEIAAERAMNELASLSGGAKSSEAESTSKLFDMMSRDCRWK